MKILITGGAGFIGSNLTRALLGEEWVDEVRIIDDFSTGFEANLRGPAAEARLHRASILDEQALEAAAKGVDAVVHLAALGSVPRSVQAPLASHASNATGTLHVLQAARKNSAYVVLASSSSVYGANPTLPKVETLVPQPMSPYAVSKLATEQYAMSYATCYELEVLPFRFFNVFGPRQMPGHAYAAVVPVFVDQALRGRALTMNGDGEQSRDFTYVGTVVEALRRAVRHRVTGGPTNLAFGTRTTLNNLAKLIGAEVGVEPQVEHRPDRPGDVRHSQADNSQLVSLFPDLVPTPIEEGLAATVSWMRNEHHGRD